MINPVKDHPALCEAVTELRLLNHEDDSGGRELAGFSLCILQGLIRVSTRNSI